MDNEKILELARKNKVRGNEYENREVTRSNLLGSFTALIVGIALFLLEFFIRCSINIGLLAVGMTAAGVQSLYEGIKLKKVHLVIVGIVQGVIAIAFILVAVIQVV